MKVWDILIYNNESNGFYEGESIGQRRDISQDFLIDFGGIGDILKKVFLRK